MNHETVLVTGGSGFVAGHCILHLLEKGHHVRATLRSVSREADVRKTLSEAGMTNDERLSFVEADLMVPDSWAAAMDSVRDVLHVASPVTPGYVENEQDVIGPAREGTLCVLRAARKAGVRRVVLTSAFHAVAWGHPKGDHLFTEVDWTILDGPGTDAYARSKTLAEQAAWAFVVEAGGPELVTLLPVAILGPALGRNVAGGNHIVQRMLSGSMPALPNLHIPIVDVRDVARAHLLALQTSEAAGARILLSNGPAWPMRDIAGLLRARLGTAAARVPHRQMPDVLLRILGTFRPEVRTILPDLGRSRATSNEKARRLLGWTARPVEDAIISAARSIIDQDMDRA